MIKISEILLVGPRQEKSAGLRDTRHELAPVNLAGY